MLLTTEKPFIVNKPEYKFEMVLFLPPNPERKAEGGLRTKGVFKHSYKLIKSECECESESKSSPSLSHSHLWYICDTEGNPVKPAPDDIQQKIHLAVNSEQWAAHRSQFTVHRSPFTELPLITVITVVYNGAKYLEQTIQSVINQTYPNVEYIIIDGGSTDGTLDIIRKYENYIDYWVSEPDKGIYDAMNKGIRLAYGKWINFMNSGDVFLSASILFDIYLTEKFNYFGVVYGDTAVDYGDYIIVRKAKSIDKIKFGMCFQHQSSFSESILLKRYGFDDNFRLAADYDFFLKLKKKGVKFFYIDSVISSVLPYGVSDSNRIAVNKEYHVIKKINNYLTMQTVIYYNYKLIFEIIKRIIKSLLPDWAIELIRRYRNPHKLK
jgi:glycosyltransferase involved in cell wall biosynthesis